MADILIVDDDDTLRENLRDLFEAEHRCRVAATAEQAISWLETETYDVIVTDISMPGLSGIDLLGFIRQHQPVTPVIVISGAGSEERGQDLIRRGAYKFLKKPFSVEDVERSVLLALEHRRRLQDERQRSRG